MSEERKTIGVVHTVNPARRQLRVNPLSGCARTFEGLRWIRIAARDGVERRCRVSSIRPNKKNIIVELAAGVTRDTVAQMKGASVVLRSGEDRTPHAGEYSARQLIGWPVVTADGAKLGTVTGFLETAANDVLEIEKPTGGMMLIPAIAEVIRSVDWDDKRIEVGDITPFAVDEGGEGAGCRA